MVFGLFKSRPGLPEIRARVRVLVDQVGAPPGDPVSYGGSRQDGTPHIEAGSRYHFVVCERGNEFERRTTDDLDDLLYWIFDGVTFSMASNFEVKHRRTGEDTRRQLFAKQIEYLERLSPEWAARQEAEHAEILSRHPFVDK
ncbi:Imm63 family immunity protein [Sphingomonas sp. HF-S3]|uniref:Imm63 family immunity protein n=1 Tax=Sphingomonas rustica TaxID=3103142 RepID=A0ABV0BAB2_9SPHN